jgi:hypothetical membrane protein
MSGRRKFFALCGISAPIIFIILVALASLLRNDFSQTQNFVSDLGVGPYSYIQNLNFIIFGTLSLFLAFGLKDALPADKSKSLKAGVFFVFLFSLGVVLAGFFPENYLNQVPHNLVSATAFLTIILAQFLIWNGLKKDRSSNWDNYAKYCLISGLLSFIFLIILRISINYYPDYQGAAQRLFLAVPWIWIGISGWKLYKLG